jgi:hypothetical protein
MPRLAFQNQDDLVIRQHSCQQLFLQPAGCPRAITPPAVGATTHDVRTIDDQDLHSDSVGESSLFAQLINGWSYTVDAAHNQWMRLIERESQLAALHEYAREASQGQGPTGARFG